jgi:hypothetical protein
MGLTGVPGRWVAARATPAHQRTPASQRPQPPDVLAGDEEVARIGRGYRGAVCSASQAANAAALPHPVSGSMSAVSCPRANICVAVGQGSGLYAGPVIERWNGRHWFAQYSPELGTGIVYLSGVSCSSARACIVVGSDGLHALVLRWNGRRWAVQATPNQVGGTSTSLDDVSCVSARVCVAVGSTTIGPGPFGSRPLAMEWNGQKWTMEHTSSPPPFQPSSGVGGQVAPLESVSCTSARACVAVGTITDQDYHTSSYHAFAEQWNGARWVLSELRAATLSDVSCGSANSCMAVGGENSVLRWDGHRWLVLLSARHRKGLAAMSLDGVSCTTATACTVIGICGAGKRSRRVGGAGAGRRKSSRSPAL